MLPALCGLVFVVNAFAAPLGLETFVHAVAIAALFAAVHTFNDSATNGELTAMATAGVSLLRIAASPILLTFGTSVAFTLAAVLLTQRASENAVLGMLLEPVFGVIVCAPSAALFAKRDRSIPFFIGLAALVVFFSVSQALTAATGSSAEVLAIPAAFVGALALVGVGLLYRHAQ